MKKYFKIYMILIILLVGCRDSNIPFNNSSYDYINNPDSFDEGEFSIENLAFKVLRNTEAIGDLIDLISASYDQIYTEKFKTFFENSITIICIPKQRPKYGSLYSRQNFAALIIPDIPLSPKPGATISPEATNTWSASFVEILPIEAIRPFFIPTSAT